ncbi:hypothetical protein BJX64DRAFT_258720 [Aspergillus heterothallicus]
MYGGAATGTTGAHYDPRMVEGKAELDSAPVHERGSDEQPLNPVPDKQAHSPFDDSATISHRPPAAIIAELAGDNAVVEMSDSHRVNELEGEDGTPKKW